MNVATSSTCVGLLCLPTLSTHGYEVIRRDAIPEVSAVLAAFLLC